MHIAILGCRGIPNHYGGFEQFAQYLSQGLVNNGFTVTVYNTHNHPYQEPEWRGVNIVHCKDPEKSLGTIGQFIYDLNCIMHARKQNYDIIYQLGYTSSSIWGKWLPKNKSIIITNMDGLEWKRSKYSKTVRKFLSLAERLAVKHSDHLIADSKGIQEYLFKMYRKKPVYIPYGARVFEYPDLDILAKYELSPHHYNLLISRLEPENSVECILDGVQASGLQLPFLVIGNYDTKFGEYIRNKFASLPQIRFLGAIYDLSTLDNLRYFSRAYFHGHTVGGTNPSLLEAMASEALICAHDNTFNRSLLEEDAYYFNDAEEVSRHLLHINKEHPKNRIMIDSNIKKIRTVYSWQHIIDQYVRYFREINNPHVELPSFIHSAE